MSDDCMRRAHDSYMRQRIFAVSRERRTGTVSHVAGGDIAVQFDDGFTSLISGYAPGHSFTEGDRVVWDNYDLKKEDTT